MAQPGPRQVFQSRIITWLDGKKVSFGGTISAGAREGSVVDAGSSGSYDITDDDLAVTVSLPITYNPGGEDQEDNAFILEPPVTVVSCNIQLASSNFRKFLRDTFAEFIADENYTVAASYTFEINYSWVITGGTPSGAVTIRRSAFTLKGEALSEFVDEEDSVASSASSSFRVDTSTWEVTQL
jgi:hypothetical protein